MAEPSELGVARLALNQRGGESEARADMPPSAELKPGQLGTHSLSPFDILDPILKRYVERDESVEQIVAAGFERATVIRVILIVDRADYKRRQ